MVRLRLRTALRLAAAMGLDPTDEGVVALVLDMALHGGIAPSVLGTTAATSAEVLAALLADALVMEAGRVVSGAVVIGAARKAVEVFCSFLVGAIVVGTGVAIEDLLARDFSTSAVLTLQRYRMRFYL